MMVFNRYVKLRDDITEHRVSGACCLAMQDDCSQPTAVMCWLCLVVCCLWIGCLQSVPLARFTKERTGLLGASRLFHQQWQGLKTQWLNPLSTSLPCQNVSTLGCSSVAGRTAWWSLRECYTQDCLWPAVRARVSWLKLLRACRKFTITEF
jgi:hypothetical protein